MQRRQNKVFIHKFDNFTKYQLKNTAKLYGLLRRDSLESHLWVYELYGQIQKRAKGRTILKGGAAAQLFLPLEFQRCTADIDFATDLKPRDLFAIMKSIKDDFSSIGFMTSFKEYIPRKIRQTGRTIPMMTFIFDIPFIFKTRKRVRFPGIKIDILFLDLDKIPAEKINDGKTFGMKLSYTPIATDKYSTISDKLITLASNTLGLETTKLEGIYKNIYDLYCLIRTYNNLESFKIISKSLKHSLEQEIEIKNGKNISINNLLEDILFTLYEMTTFDLEPEFNNNSTYTLHRFEEESLQEEIINLLTMDLWSIMSCYLYIWIYALMHYIKTEDYTKLEGINVVQEQFDYYLTLEKRGRRRFKADLKRRILEKDPLLNLDSTSDVLRLMFLDYILTYLISINTQKDS